MHEHISTVKQNVIELAQMIRDIDIWNTEIEKRWSENDTCTNY